MGPHSNYQGIGTLIFILLGPIVWAVHLTLIYGSQSILCAFNPAGDKSGEIDAVVVDIILIATIVCIATVGVSAVRARFVRVLIAGAAPPAEQDEFIVTIMRVLAGLSILAMFLASLGTLILPPCDQLR